MVRREASDVDTRRVLGERGLVETSDHISLVRHCKSERCECGKGAVAVGRCPAMGTRAEGFCGHQDLSIWCLVGPPDLFVCPPVLGTSSGVRSQHGQPWLLRAQCQQNPGAQTRAGWAARAPHVGRGLHGVDSHGLWKAATPKATLFSGSSSGTPGPGWGKAAFGQEPGLHFR